MRARGIAAGLHAVLDLPADGPSEAEVLAALAADGVAADGLSRYWHRPGPRPSGLVVGFGAPAEHAFPAALGGAGRRAGALLPLNPAAQARAPAVRSAGDRAQLAAAGTTAAATAAAGATGADQAVGGRGYCVARPAIPARR